MTETMSFWGHRLMCFRLSTAFTLGRNPPYNSFSSVILLNVRNNKTETFFGRSVSFVSFNKSLVLTIEPIA